MTRPAIARHRPSAAAGCVALLIASAGAITPPVSAAPAAVGAAAAQPERAETFRVGSVTLRYTSIPEGATRATAGELLDEPVALVRRGGVWDAARDRELEPASRPTLRRVLADGSAEMTPDGVREVLNAAVELVSRRSGMGAFVSTDAARIDLGRRVDARAAGDLALPLEAFVSPSLARVRSGERPEAQVDLQDETAGSTPASGAPVVRDGGGDLLPMTPRRVDERVPAGAQDRRKDVAPPAGSPADQAPAPATDREPALDVDPEADPAEERERLLTLDARREPAGVRPAELEEGQEPGRAPADSRDRSPGEGGDGAGAQPTEAPRPQPVDEAVLEPLSPVRGEQPAAVPAPAGATEAPERPAVLESDGTSYAVSRVEFEYADPQEALPPVSVFGEMEVSLSLVGDVWTEPAEGQPVFERMVSEIGSGGMERLTPGAVRQIAISAVRTLNDRGLVGVYVVPEGIDLLNDGGDLRDPEEGGVLRLTVLTARAVRVRTIAGGERIPLAERIDNPAHERIRRWSPVRPFPDREFVRTPEPAETEPIGTVSEGVSSGISLRNGVPGPRRDGVRYPPSPEPVPPEERERKDLLRQDELSDYAIRLSRHPGRRVDVAIAPGGDTDEAEVQYLVREAKPWTAFFQISNTGTDPTSNVRERIGFVHNQLLGLDDIFTIEYTTANFAFSHAVTASYSQPFFENERLRWTLAGGWSEFEASDVGVTGEEFRGESWFYTAELAWNFLQRGELFLDFYGGFSYRDISIQNLGLSDGFGQDAFFLPRFGVRAERLTPTSAFRGQVQLEYNIPEIGSTSEADLETLGRINVPAQFSILTFDFQYSTFLEPVFDREAWLDSSTWKSSTLAHELVLSLRGQYSFNNRLIPNLQRVVGGLFTVRGYSESVVAGDSVINGTIEYRFHIPRAFKPYSVSGTEAPTLFNRQINFAPPTVYGSPDIDIVWKAFMDFARSDISQNLAIERDEGLWSVGTGVDVLLFRNVSFRADWAVALEPIAPTTPSVTTRGSNRFHLLLTVLF